MTTETLVPVVPHQQIIRPPLSLTRSFAKTIQKMRILNLTYGLLDGWSLANTAIKYCFDLPFTSSKLSTELMRKWFLTRDGLAVRLSLAAVFIIHAILANMLSQNKSVMAAHIIASWSYLRDMIKSLKNTYKGVRGSLQLIKLLGGGAVIIYFVTPISLVLGGLSVILRYWYQRMGQKRREMLKGNAKLLLAIQEKTELSEKSIKKLHNKIRRQTNSVKTRALAVATYAGVIDGLYLFVAALSFSALSPPILFVMTGFLGVYFLSCIISRVYSEYDNQKKILISAAKIELALKAKELERVFATLAQVTVKLQVTAYPNKYISTYNKLLQRAEHLVFSFAAQKKKLASLSRLSYQVAVLHGLKGGLAAYQALLAITVVLFVTPFPPGVIITIVSLGLVLLATNILYSVIKNYMHRLEYERQQAMKLKISSMQLTELLIIYQQPTDHFRDLKLEEITEIITKEMNIESGPHYFRQEWFEVLRSIFSGMGKGLKMVDLKVSPSGDSEKISMIKLIAISISALFHMLIQGVRTFARQFGRDSHEVPLVKDEGDKLTVKIEPVSPVEQAISIVPSLGINLYSSKQVSQEEVGDNSSTLMNDSSRKTNYNHDVKQWSPEFFSITPTKIVIGEQEEIKTNRVGRAEEHSNVPDV